MADVDSVLPTNSHKDDCAMSRDAARAEEPTNAHTKTLDFQAVLSSAFVAPDVTRSAAPTVWSRPAERFGDEEHRDTVEWTRTQPLLSRN